MFYATNLQLYPIPTTTAPILNNNNYNNNYYNNYNYTTNRNQGGLWHSES